MRARLSETEKKNRNNEELRRSDMAIWAQDNAILVQKIEFLEQEVEELKIKREEENSFFAKNAKNITKLMKRGIITVMMRLKLKLCHCWHKKTPFCRRSPVRAKPAASV